MFFSNFFQTGKIPTKSTKSTKILEKKKFIFHGSPENFFFDYLKHFSSMPSRIDELAYYFLQKEASINLFINKKVFNFFINHLVHYRDGEVVLIIAPEAGRQILKGKIENNFLEIFEKKYKIASGKYSLKKEEYNEIINNLHKQNFHMIAFFSGKESNQSFWCIDIGDKKKILHLCENYMEILECPIIEKKLDHFKIASPTFIKETENGCDEFFFFSLPHKYRECQKLDKEGKKVITDNFKVMIIRKNKYGQIDKTYICFKDCKSLIKKD